MGELEIEENKYHEDDEIVSTIRKNLKNHASHYREWRQKARESYNFVASEQWTDEEKKLLQDSHRTPIVFNRVARTINAVLGLELQNRQEVSYKPVQNTSTGVADLMNAAAKWVRSNCDAEDEESEAFGDVLIGGVGATETSVDYSTDLDGMVVVERIDPFECAADHRAKKRNFDDARWVARWKAYSKEEFEEMYPSVEVEGKDLLAWGDDEASVKHADDEYKYNEDQEQADDSIYTVVKYQYYCEEQMHRILVNGGLKTLNQGEYDAVAPALEGQGIKSQPQKKRVYKQVILCRDIILEQSEAPIDGFSIRFITGLRDRNKNIWFGLVELMKDPQRWANKWLSQIQFILNSNAKGGLLYETNTFVNPKKAKADWAKPNAWIELVKGALTENRVKDRTPPPYPDGIDRLLQQALTAINDVPGVNVEMLGIADRNQPGMIENSRKDAGVTILASFFDSLRRYRKEQGRVLQKFIFNYISDGRLVRIDGAAAKYMPLNRDGMSEKYDILVDDAPTSPNMKEKTFSAISGLLQVALQAGIPIPPEILEYSPLPAELVEKWVQLIQQTKAPDPEKEKMKQAISDLQTQLKVTAEELINKEDENAVKREANDIKRGELGVKKQELEIERVRVDNELIKACLDANAPEDSADCAPQKEKSSGDIRLLSEAIASQARELAGGLHLAIQANAESTGALVDAQLQGNTILAHAVNGQTEALNRERHIIKDESTGEYIGVR